MFALLQSLFNGLYSIILFIVSIFNSLVQLVSILPSFITLASDLIAYLPSPIISVALVTISVYVLYLVIGR